MWQNLEGIPTWIDANPWDSRSLPRLGWRYSALCISSLAMPGWYTGAKRRWGTWGGRDGKVRWGFQVSHEANGDCLLFPMSTTSSSKTIETEPAEPIRRGKARELAPQALFQWFLSWMLSTSSSNGRAWNQLTFEQFVHVCASVALVY